MAWFMLSQDKCGDILVFCFWISISASLVSKAVSFLFYLKARTEEKINWSDRILKKFHLPNIFKDDVPVEPPNYFTATFQANKLHK